MPTISPGWMVSGTICSSDSSTRMGSPAVRGVAAARTNSHRGVMTAVPKELSLGLTRWTLNESNLSSCVYSGLRERLRHRVNQLRFRQIADDGSSRRTVFLILQLFAMLIRHFWPLCGLPTKKHPSGDVVRFPAACG